MADLKELIRRTRSHRRFKQDAQIPMDHLLELVDAARLSGSARNMQSLRYLLFNQPDACERIFPTLAWAGYLKDWSGPAAGEQPAAYIVQLADLELSKDWWCDDGIALQSILLTATDLGYGGCIIGSVQREQLRSILHIPGRYQILHVLALGVPAEEVVIDEMRGEDVRYWRDDQGVHHVPKRKLDDLILTFK